jgi:hypothetical protein
VQILIQLKRFNQSAQAALSARARTRATPAIAVGAGTARGSRTRPNGGSPLQQDLSSILGTPDSDKAAIDTSVGGALSA